MFAIFLIAILGTFAWLAWRDRSLALGALAVVLPLYLVRFTLFVPFTLLEGLILVLTVIWIVHGEWKQIKNLSRPWLWAAAGMLFAACIATLVNPDHRAALGILKAYFFEPILLFLIAATTLKTKTEKQRLLDGLILGAVSASTIALFQFLSGLGIPVPWDITRRVTGPFDYPNALGLYVGPILILAVFRLYDLIKQKQSRQKILLWSVACLVMVIGILLAESEGACVAVAATLFIASLFSSSLRRFTLSIGLAAAILVLAISPLRQALFTNLTFHGYSGEVRRTQWEETWNMLKAHPIFGAGLSGYPVALAPYHTHLQYEIFQYPHTLVFNIWSELGLLGLAAFLWLASITVQTVRNVKKESADPFMAYACFAALLEMTIHGLADVPYFKNDLSAMTWLLLALLCVAIPYAKRKNV